MEEPDINKCPTCGGVADQGFDRCYPPNPYECTKCEAKWKQPVPESTQPSVEEILNGIDKTETESPDGWWETSVGAEFGAKKLTELKAALRYGRQPVSVEDVARAIFESRHPFSWDVASKRVLNENLYAEADQCRRDAKAAMRACGVKVD